MTIKDLSTSFTARRINSTTFAVREEDAFGEWPLIYVKIYQSPRLLLITDTGCDAPSSRHEKARYVHLRKFFEEYPVPSNKNMPLNPHGRAQYVLLLTHCHYDHIGGVKQFLPPSQIYPGTPRTTVISSLTGENFVKHNLWEHSICKDLGLPDPTYYRPDIFAADSSKLFASSSGSIINRPVTEKQNGDDEVDLGIMILNTPGHTPDEIAWYDDDERKLYVGDTLYLVAPIIIPKEGIINDYMTTLQRLLQFVETKNAEGGKKVSIACGHVNYDGDAYETIVRVQRFMCGVLTQDIPMLFKRMHRGEYIGFWSDPEEDIALTAPVRLIEDASG